MTSPRNLYNLLRNTREAGTSDGLGVRVIRDRMSTNDQLNVVMEALEGPVESSVSYERRTHSYEEPGVPGVENGNTIGLWHCNDASGLIADDAGAEENDLTLVGPTWIVSSKFDGGLSFNGSSTYGYATVDVPTPVGSFLYFSAWAKPTSGPVFNWDGVMEIYISGGNLVAEVEGSTYTGPPVSVGTWQHFHCQFDNGVVLVGVDDVVYRFAHGDATIAVSAYAIEIGRRSAVYYSGELDEVLLTVDIKSQEDWGPRTYQAHPGSVLYCSFDKGYGTTEHHADFLGPDVSLVGCDWASGYLKNAISLDGSAYATFTPAAKALDKLSIEIVFKLDAIAQTTFVDQASGINLEFTGTHLRAALDGVSNPSSDIGPLSLSIDTWYMLTMVWDGAEKQAWLNGQKVGSVAATGTANIPASVVYVGRTVGGVNDMVGDLDFLHIVNVSLRPLTRTIQRFNAGLDGFALSDEWILM